MNFDICTLSKHYYNSNIEKNEFKEYIYSHMDEEPILEVYLSYYFLISNKQIIIMLKLQ